MTLVLGIDAGTGGCRAVLADTDDARIVSTAERRWTPSPDADGFPSLDAEEMARAAIEAAAEASGRNAVAAVGVCSQRNGVVLLDAGNKSLHAGPNTDPRGAVYGIAMEHEHGKAVYEIAGRLPVMLYMPARLAWFRNHRPDIFEHTTKVLSFADWLAFKLSGEIATDPSQAAELLCYDVRAGSYSETLCEMLGVDPSLLPPVTTEPAGAFHGAPVVRAGGDTQCAALGMNITKPGAVSIPAGTTMPVGCVTADPTLDPQRRTWTSPHAVPKRFVVEAHCAEAAGGVDWLLGLVGATPQLIEEAATTTEPGAGGVLNVGAGPTNVGDFPLGRTGMFRYPLPAFVLGRSRNDFVRAALENVAFAAREATGWMREITGSDASDVALSGGLARSRGFATIVASALGRSVRRSTTPQASALGAAVAAANAAGIRMRGQAGETVEPEHNYDHLYDEWLALRTESELTMMRISHLKGMT